MENFREKTTIIEDFLGLSDKTKLEAIRDKMSNPNKGGRIVGGVSPRKSKKMIQWINTELGQSTYNRALLISSGLEKQEGEFSDFKSVTALGGICAFRTKDFEDIAEGRISSPRQLNSPPQRFFFRGVYNLGQRRSRH